jgi:hypothetical protein
MSAVGQRDKAATCTGPLQKRRISFPRTDAISSFFLNNLSHLYAAQNAWQP